MRCLALVVVNYGVPWDLASHTKRFCGAASVVMAFFAAVEAVINLGALTVELSMAHFAALETSGL